MTKKPLVSVIIANYNSEGYIKNCIDSLREQTYNNLEIIICDDNSTDNSPAIIKDMPNIIFMKNGVNSGAALSRNKCIKQSTGEYILIQDADDYSSTNRIEKLLKAIVDNEVDFVSSGMARFDDNGVYDYFYPKTAFPKKEDFLMNLPFVHAATLFKREALLNVGGYRVAKETRRGQDYDLFMRLYAKGYVGMNLFEPLYFYRDDKNTQKRRKYKYRIAESIIRYKGFKNMKLLPKGFIFVVKPLIVGLIPYKILNKIKKGLG